VGEHRDPAGIDDWTMHLETATPAKASITVTELANAHLATTVQIRSDLPKVEAPPGLANRQAISSFEES
jgi:hypothetical protein